MGRGGSKKWNLEIRYDPSHHAPKNGIVILLFTHRITSSLPFLLMSRPTLPHCIYKNWNIEIVSESWHILCRQAHYRDSRSSSRLYRKRTETREMSDIMVQQTHFINISEMIFRKNKLHSRNFLYSTWRSPRTWSTLLAWQSKHMLFLQFVLIMLTVIEPESAVFATDININTNITYLLQLCISL